MAVSSTSPEESGEAAILSDPALQRIAAAMPKGAHINPTVFEVYAGGYLELKRREGLLHERGLKADLTALHRKLVGLAEELQNLPIQKLGILGVSLEVVATRGRNSGIKRVELLADELRELAGAVQWFLARASQPLSRGGISITIALAGLGTAYWRATGKKPTHSSHRDGEHMARPLSPFGKLVVAFFREVDPSLTERALTTAVRAYVASAIAKMPPEGRPQS